MEEQQEQSEDDGNNKEMVCVLRALRTHSASCLLELALISLAVAMPPWRGVVVFNM